MKAEHTSDELVYILTHEEVIQALSKWLKSQGQHLYGIGSTRFEIGADDAVLRIVWKRTGEEQC